MQFEILFSALRAVRSRIFDVINILRIPKIATMLYILQCSLCCVTLESCHAALRSVVFCCAMILHNTSLCCTSLHC